MSVAVALTVSFVLTGALMVGLRRARVLDIPNARSSHQVATPRGGGIAVIAALVAALLVEGDVDWMLVGAAVVLTMVGLVDDVRSLSARLRLAALLGVALVVVTSLVGAAQVWPPLFVAAGIFGVVGYINAFNFMDGVNGISALHALVAGGWFLWLSQQYDLSGFAAVGTGLAGAALGFFPWNVTGRIFLGDVGSYGLGAIIAFISLDAWSSGVPVPLVLAPLSVYLADTGWVLVKRARAGEPLTTPHCDHVYQRLIRLGWRHLGSATWSALVATLVCGALALLWSAVPVLGCALALAFVLLYLSSPILWSKVCSPDEVPA